MPGLLPATAVKAVQPSIDRLAATLPSGYRIVPGGSVEESAKAQASVQAVLPAMAVLVLTILMFQLQSFQRVLLVLSVAPLGLIGVVAALLLAQKPMGFVAMLGVLALVGMIARNSVILIDQIGIEIAAGHHPWDAVVIAAIHRTRPILLTAAAATLGMIPIAPTVFWGPMAFAIIGGLTVATVLTLIFPPPLCAARVTLKEKGDRAKQGARETNRRSWPQTLSPARVLRPRFGLWSKPALAMESQISARASTKGNRLPVLNAKLLNPRY